MTVWFSGDQHLSHDSKHGGIIQYCNRPFVSLKEMNSVIIDRMLEKVHKGDTLYSLGDLTFKKDVALKFVEIIKKNNINLIYIRGNHDKNILPILNTEGIKVYDLLTINIAKQPIVLCHYAMRTWDNGVAITLGNSIVTVTTHYLRKVNN
jgi:calcineurin-like phosphoesterase family protein